MIPKEEQIDLSKMSVEEARVLIAKDALRLLDSKFIRTNGFAYLYFPELYTMGEAAQLDVALRNSDNCHVCAIGALFVSTVLRNNAITIGDLPGGPTDTRCEIVRYLNPYFAEGQLRMIEAAFEGWTAGDGKYDGATFMPQEHDKEKLLRAILNNIIENNGTFVHYAGISALAK